MISEGTLAQEASWFLPVGFLRPVRSPSFPRTHGLQAGASHCVAGSEKLPPLFVGRRFIRGDPDNMTGEARPGLDWEVK